VTAPEPGPANDQKGRPQFQAVVPRIEVRGKALLAPRAEVLPLQ